MKKILTFILILLIFSCGNQSNQDNAYNDTLSTDELLNIKDSSTEDAEGNEPCKLLLSISKDDPGVKESLQNYINMLSEEIKSEDQIIKIFAFRKELIPKLDKIIVKFLDSTALKRLNSLKPTSLPRGKKAWSKKLPVGSRTAKPAFCLPCRRAPPDCREDAPESRLPFHKLSPAKDSLL